MTASAQAPGATARLWVLTRHELRRARRSALNRSLYTAIAFGVSLFVIRAFDYAFFLSGKPQANGSEQAIPGQAVMFGLILLVFLGYSCYDEFAHGTWSRLEHAGASPAEIVGSKLLVTFLAQLAHVGVLYALGIAVLGMEVRGSWAALIALIVMTAMCITAFGFLAFAVARTEGVFTVICWIGALGMTAIGGGLAPYPFLPGWAKAISPAAPTYWIFRASNDIVIDGAGFGDVGWRLGVIAAFTVGYALLGAIVLDPHRERAAMGL